MRNDSIYLKCSPLLGFYNHNFSTDILYCFFIYLSYSVIQETLYLNHMDKLFLFRCPCYKKICVYLSRKINIKNTHQKVFNEVTVQESSNEKPVLSLTDCIIRFSLIVYRPSFFVSH